MGDALFADMTLKKMMAIPVGAARYCELHELNASASKLVTY